MLMFVFFYKLTIPIVWAKKTVVFSMLNMVV